MADLNNSLDSAKSQINAVKTYTEIAAAAKELKKSAGNSFSDAKGKVATTLEDAKKFQKRYQRNQPTSFDELLELINLTSGSGSSTLRYLRKKLLEVVVKIEPEVRKILTEETIKVLGCSQEQTFTGYTTQQLTQRPLSRFRRDEGIYVPVESLDLSSLLKSPVSSKIGQIFYEKDDPSAVPRIFKPFSGPKAFPMNKELNLRMENANSTKSFQEQYNKFYQGTSGLPLFDIIYSPLNEYGETQPCFKVALVNKPINFNNITNTNPGDTINKVGVFLNDYYSTIKLIDSVNITQTLINILTGAISIQANAGYQAIGEASKFEVILRRILGLCFDSKTVGNQNEIDVSGVSKIAELDGVDDSFFEFSEVDLRNIDIRISNVQNGVMEFVDCDNVKLPVDYETLIDELIKFRDDLDNQTPEQQINSINNTLDTIYQNPEWESILPTNFNVQAAVNTDILKQIPLAVASAVLSPKVLLPIFILIQVVEGQRNPGPQRPQTPTNTQTGSPTDFLRVFKSFNIQVVSRIGAIFLKVLYEELKKDILNLVSSVISDVSRSQKLKKYTIILRLVNILLILAQLIDDFRKCKSLVNNILSLLKTIFGISDGSIPFPLLLLTQFLPGTSPERAAINTIELLQSVGIPTGPLPDGSPNLMGIYNLMTHRGADKEESENGKVESTVIVPPLVGGLLPVYGKKR